RFLGNPCVPTPCSPTPAGPTRQAIRRSRRGPRSDKNEDSHHEDFGAQSHGLGTRCLRFVPSIAARGRKTRFPLLATLRDGLGYPQDSDERFRVASYISSPFPRLSWRNVAASPRHLSSISFRSVRMFSETAFQCRSFGSVVLNRA